MAEKKIKSPPIIPLKIILPEEKLLEDEDNEEVEAEAVDSAKMETSYSNPMKSYLKEIKDLPLLSFEEEKSLAERIKKNDKEARQKMIQANLRLVISVAKKYANLGMPLPDLIEEGNMGLMKAVDRYDLTRGYRFSTYAIWWIKQAIIRALANQGKTIRVPVYMAEIINRLRKTTTRLSQKLRRPPTDHELARELKIDVEKVKIIKAIIQNPSSLEKPMGDEGTGQLLNIIADESNVSPFDGLSSILQQERIMNLLKELPPRTAEIISLRFGLGGSNPHTLEETGRKFGITRERVRQIEVSAMKKLKGYMSREENEIKIGQGGKDDKRKTKG